jgi:CHAD domain-containing protein
LGQKLSKSDVPTSLSTYVEGLFRDLSHFLPPALQKSQTTAIHRVRVTTRRLSTVISILQPHLKAKNREQLERDLRKLRRRLGRLRDIDVMIKQLRRHRKKYPQTVEWLQKQLHKQRAKAEKGTIAKRLMRFSPPKAGNDLVKTAIAAEKSLRPHLARLIDAQFIDFSRRAEALMLSAAKGQSPDVHALRIAGKHFRYSLELAAAAGAPLEPRGHEQLKNIQDVLGAWHDQAVLVQYAMKMAAKNDLPVTSANLLRELLSFMQDISSNASRQIEAFVAVWKRDREGLSSAIDELKRISNKVEHDAIPGPARQSPQRRKRPPAAADGEGDQRDQSRRGVSEAPAAAGGGDVA